MIHRIESDENVLSTRHGEPAEQLGKPDMEFNAAVSDAAYARIRARAAALKMGAMDWTLYKVWLDEGRR